MNIKRIIISGLLLISTNMLFGQQKFLSKTFSLSIDGKGNITTLEVLPAGKNLVETDSTGVLLQVVKNGKSINPNLRLLLKTI